MAEATTPAAVVKGPNVPKELVNHVAGATTLAAIVKGPKGPNVPKELVNHVATAFELIHNDGKAYAVYRGRPVDANGQPYGPDEPPRVARQFGPSLRRYIVGVAWARYGRAIGRG